MGQPFSTRCVSEGQPCSTRCVSFEAEKLGFKTEGLTSCRTALIQKLTLIHRVAKELEVAQMRRFKMRYLVGISLAHAAGWELKIPR